jgi:hypothetical protein
MYMSTALTPKRIYAQRICKMNSAYLPQEHQLIGNSKRGDVSCVVKTEFLYNI